MSQLLNRQAAAIRTTRKTRTVHGQTEIPAVRPTGWKEVEPPPPVPPGGVEPGDPVGEGDPPTAPGAADAVGEGKGEPAGEDEGEADGLGFGLGNGLGVGDLIV
jgi:hypothetical protein